MAEYPDRASVGIDQYRDTGNLNARIRLHESYSVNHYGWQRWVFDHLALPVECRVLEIGCGPGNLWLANRPRVAGGWRLTLVDLSPGMAAAARRNLASSAGKFTFATAGAQDLPFPDGAFDAVIANHMLYHVPDRGRALVEIRRVLLPGGRLYAATNGRTHLAELYALMEHLGLRSAMQAEAASFSLENGAAQLAPCFPEVSLERYPDAFEVTAVQPLVDYILSIVPGGPLHPAELRAALAHELAARGAIHITKDSGLFSARRA